MTKLTSWRYQQLRDAQKTPEELAAWKARRAAVERARRVRIKLAKGEPPPKVAAEQARERAERLQREEAEFQAFLAAGAPTKGYSAFLRSREAALAVQLNRSSLEERIAA